MGDAAFTALTTQRLVVRRFRPQDLDTFVAYRSDPQVARYQSWEAPYPPSQAHQFLQALQATIRIRPASGSSSPSRYAVRIG
jgi:RimJ/RimL family protein N-acetyltransferase